MNGDGHPDIVMDNEFFNTTSVLLNNGDGTFGAKFDTPAGSLPNADAVGDFNGDGKPDIVVTNVSSPARWASSWATATARSSPCRPRSSALRPTP